MHLLDWNQTVAGAVLCLLYGWFLTFFAQYQGIRVSKMGLLCCMSGLIVLAGMAVVSPTRISKPEGMPPMHIRTLEGFPRASQSEIRFKKLLSIAARTTEKVGRKPSKDHRAYESSSGKLSWVTKEERAKLLKRN